MTKTKKSNKKTPSKKSPAPKSKKGIGRKANSQSTQAPAEEASSAPTYSSPDEARKAAWSDYVQKNADLASKLLLHATNPYSGATHRSPFGLCEDIRVHLDRNAPSFKEKMFILKCLMEYYQAKEQRKVDAQASRPWTSGGGVYGPTAYVDAKLPEGVPVPGQEGAKR